MKLEQFFLTISFLLILSPTLNAQPGKQSTSDINLQDIYNQIDRLDKKIDAKFEEIDKRFEQIDRKFEQIDKRFVTIEKRLTEIEKNLIKYDERFQSIMSIFTIFGSVFGFVILIALAVFGYFFNQLRQIIKEIALIQARFETKQYKLEDELFREDVIRKLQSYLRKDYAEPTRIADEESEYKTKSK